MVGRGRMMPQPHIEGEARLNGGTCLTCCLCLFVCAVFSAVVTYLIWCIIVVSNNGQLQESKCEHVANVWWTIMLMLIIQVGPERQLRPFSPDEFALCFGRL